MIKIDEKYTDYRDDTDPDYPGGKAVNASAGESTDGTPLLADWMNDINGARQALFVEAFGSISGVSNKPDNIKDSDVLKSIKKITESYTDKEIKKEAAQREQKDSDFFASAKSYVDGKIREEASVRSSEDSRILQSANTYTDRRISGEAASRKTEDANTLSSAKNYTDRKTISLQRDFNAKIDSKTTIKKFVVNGNNGYVLWGNGLLIQWGLITGYYGYVAPFYFPVSFSTDTYAVAGAAMAASNENLVTFSILKKTKSEIKIRRWRGSAFDFSEEDVFIIAIGK